MHFLLSLNFLAIVSVIFTITAKYDYGYLDIMLYSIYFISSFNIFNFTFFIFKSHTMKPNYMSDDFEKLTTFSKYVLVGYYNLLKSTLGVRKQVFVNSLLNGIKITIIFSCAIIISEYKLLILLNSILFITYITSQYISLNRIIEIEAALANQEISEKIKLNMEKSVAFQKESSERMREILEDEEITLEDLKKEEKKNK